MAAVVLTGRSDDRWSRGTGAAATAHSGPGQAEPSVRRHPDDQHGRDRRAEMARNEFVFGVDLDGCVADFYGSIKPLVAEWVGRDVAALPALERAESWEEVERIVLLRLAEWRGHPSTPEPAAR